jgi:hypothetical protein
MMEKIGKFVGLCILLYVLVMALNFVTVNHIQVPGIPHAAVATEEGTPQIDPQVLADAADQTEKDAACMGDYNPPSPVNARDLCLEMHRRGCGDPRRDCTLIPADQTYYTHH